MSDELYRAAMAYAYDRSKQARLDLLKALQPKVASASAPVVLEAILPTGFRRLPDPGSPPPLERSDRRVIHHMRPLGFGITGAYSADTNTLWVQEGDPVSDKKLQMVAAWWAMYRLQNSS